MPAFSHDCWRIFVDSLRIVANDGAEPEQSVYDTLAKIGFHLVGAPRPGQVPGTTFTCRRGFVADVHGGQSYALHQELQKQEDLYLIATLRAGIAMLVGSILRQEVGFFDTTPTGRILNRFSKELEMVDRNIVGNWRTTVVFGLRLLGSAYFIVYGSSPWLLVLVPPLAISSSCVPRSTI